MSVWKRYNKEQREEYKRFLQVYGALTNLFRQKQGDLIPYLDSKFQETVFAKVFRAKNVDIGNTPHDVLSVFGDLRVGIGIKTWMNSKPSFQKVMQLKRFQAEIDAVKNNPEALAVKISEIKNDRMRLDYERLGLKEDNNIYHYVTRDNGLFTINECAYPLININNLNGFNKSETAFSWLDGQKSYKFTFSDSQIWQKFDINQKDSLLLDKFDIRIIDDPFEFLLKAYQDLIGFKVKSKSDFVEIYLPLYSYQSKEVQVNSGLNAWNGKPKNKDSDTLRPLNEVYIAIPRELHKKRPDFFVKNIFDFEQSQNEYDGDKKDKPQLRFHLILPNGKKIPALITQQGMKSLQSGSLTEIDPNTGKYYGQSALGQWLLVDVLGLKERQVVTREWLVKKGTDSVKLWRNKNDYSHIYIDFAPVGAFEAFMQNEPIPVNDEWFLSKD